MQSFGLLEVVPAGEIFQNDMALGKQYIVDFVNVEMKGHYCIVHFSTAQYKSGFRISKY